MGPEVVTISAAGQQWTAFEGIAVEAAINDATCGFAMEVAAEVGAAATAWALAPGTPVKILFNGDLAFTGYVDCYNPELERHQNSEKALIRISGRSKSQDFVDCAAIDTKATGNFQNQTLLQIAQALDQFGVGISTDQSLEPIDNYQITPGESAFLAIEKQARKLGLTLAGQPDGSIKITKAGTVRHAGGLFEGVNFVGASANLDWTNRHSVIIVRGQAASGTGSAAMRIQATSQDTAVNRYRPLVLIEDGDLDQTEAQTRADTRRDRDAGESLTASGTTQGFRDDAGTLWTPGNLVWLQSTFLNVQQLMLIKKAHFRQTRRGGSITILTMVDPRAFGGAAGKGGDAGSAWSIDEEG